MSTNLQTENNKYKYCGMIKILFFEKQLFLVPDAKLFIQENGMKDAFIFFNPKTEQLTELLDLLMLSEFNQAVIEGDVDQLLSMYRTAFVPIIAAGGMVINDEQEVLFIYRRGKWDLPKGKLDDGESIEECAVREVKEETGLADATILRPLLITYHIYTESKKYVFKTTHWYQMFSSHKELSPQTEEGITKVLWIHKNNMHQQFSKTYDSILDVFKSAI